MDAGDDYNQDVLNILPSALQSRVPDLLKRSFATLPLRRPRSATSTPQRPSSSGTATGSSHGSYLETEASLFSSSSSEASSVSAPYSESSAAPFSTLGRDMNFMGPPEDRFAMDDPVNDYRRYPQLTRLLQAAMEMDQSQNQRMLEVQQSRSRQPDPALGQVARLPQDFSISSHDAADRKWSPSGIKWRYARQGALFATQASDEMQDAAFERSAFIDGVAYYLRACPDELTEWETAKLASAAPWLVHPGSVGGAQAAHVAALTPRPTDRHGHPFLFHLVQWAVAALVVLAYGLWCSLLAACRVGAHLEREYHVSEWLVRSGFDAVNGLGRYGVALGGRLNRASDGRVGQVVGGVASWTVESVAGGIQEGYSHGMRRIQLQNAANGGSNGDGPNEVGNAASGPLALIEGLGKIIELSRLASMPLDKQAGTSQ